VPVVRQEGYLRLELDVDGLLPDPDVEAAIHRAQEKNAIIIEQEVKERARRIMATRKTDFSRSEAGERNRGAYPGPMVDYYNASVGADNTITLDNPTSRADWFEFGTVKHIISASGLSPAGQQSPPRGLRGQFTRGARGLRFPDASGEMIVRSEVEHPGQRATLVMHETVGDLLDVQAENVLDELHQEFSRG
jgi:hypothetical protein